jgi:septum site-determining protein MinC
LYSRNGELQFEFGGCWQSMKKEDIVIKGTKQGIVVSLDSSSGLEELLGELRIRLQDSKIKDLHDGGQVILDLGSRDVSQVDFSTLESIISENGLFLKRIISRPDLPTTQLDTRNTAKTKTGSSGGKNSKAKSASKKNQAKGNSSSRKGTSVAEVIQINSSVNKSKPEENLSGPPLQTPADSNMPDLLDLSDFSGHAESAAAIEQDTATTQREKNEGLVNGDNFSVDSTTESRGPKEEVRDIFRQAINQPDTVLVQRSLRSGQSIQYPGNVVVMGDVNPGAEVIASGNIVVMGSFRGVAHAGATGDESATITAFRLRPTQLRIAGHITRPPDGEPAGPDVPETARIRDGIVVIERY